MDAYKKLMEEWNGFMTPDRPKGEIEIPYAPPTYTEYPVGATNYEDLMSQWNSLTGRSPKQQTQITYPPDQEPVLQELPSEAQESPSELQEATLENREPNSLQPEAEPAPLDIPEAQLPVEQAPQQSEYDKLMSDYNNYIQSSKEQLAAASKRKDDADFNSGMLDAASQIGAGLASRGGKVYEGQKHSRMKDPTADVLEQLKLEGSKFDKAPAFKKQARESDLYDPNSEQSKSVRKMMESQFPDLKNQYGKEWDNMSAASFDDIYKVLSLKENTEARKQAAESLSGERSLLRQAKEDEKLELLKTPWGIARTNDDAKKLKEAAQNKDDFDTLLNDAIALREKHSGGQMLNRDDQKVADGLSSDLLAKYKTLIKLGVLSATDYKLLDSIVPKDILEYNSPIAAMQGQDPTLKQLYELRNRTNSQFKHSIPLRIREGFETQFSDEDKPDENKKDSVSSSNPKKTVIDTHYSASRNATKLTYSDGSTEIVAGGKPSDLKQPPLDMSNK